MSYSSLTNAYIPSPNHSGQRTSQVKKITIHHMAGDLSIEACGNVFKPASRKASANYGIGSDGRVGCYVDEENRAWTSSSGWNDQQAITIEVADKKVGNDWTVTNEAYYKLIDLCVDICKRYGISPYYDGTQNATLTEHRMFASTECPGETIHNWLANHTIENDIKQRLGQSATPQPTTDIDSLARAVIRGEYGSGETRKQRLGANYQAVQNRVNELLGVKPATQPSVNIDQLAREVIAGKYGNGEQRKKALGGYYNAVQKRVNELLK